jgi:hypothetical protein
MARSELTPEQRAWLEHDNELWRRAYAIVARHPGMDVSDVHHVLRNLERSPEERLASSMNSAGLRLYAPRARVP